MAKPKAKAKGKVKPEKPAKAAKAIAKKASNKSQESPDWLRKAMAIPPKQKGRPPGSKNKPRPVAPAPIPQAKRGRKPMAAKDKAIYDPMDDPDLRAPDPKDVQLDQSLPPKQHKPTPLVAEVEPEPAPLYDEVAAGEAIPYDNAEMLIAGTLGGGGDHHVLAKQVLGRFAEVNWLISKGGDDTPAGKSIKARRQADAKGKKDADKDHRAAKEGDDAASWHV